MKTLVIPTALLIIILFILSAIVVLFILPFLNMFRVFYFPIQKEIEKGMFNEVSNTTIETENIFSDVVEISPYLIIIFFVVGFLIIYSITEIEKRRK